MKLDDDLKWGETPWDDMTREQLLREVQRMYAALIETRGPLYTSRRENPEHPYWVSKGGTGNIAIAKMEQALAPYGREVAYRSFFRYACDLLFEGLGSNWMVCERGHMLGSYDGERHEFCHLCGVGGETVRARPITWDDLKPRPEVPPPPIITPQGPVK